MLYGSLGNAAEETVEPVPQRIATKLVLFYLLFFGKVSPKNFHKSVSELSRKICLFFHNLSEAL